MVGLEDLPELLGLIKRGVVDCTAASKRRSQRYWSVLSLWQQGLGALAGPLVACGEASSQARL